MRGMQALPALLATLFIPACVAESERTFVVLADTAVHLTGTPTVFRPTAPLRATDDINGVCVAPAEGDTLNDDWTLPGAGGRAVKLQAEAVLADSSIVRLSSTSWSGELCLHPDSAGPLPHGVRELRIWASGPIVARRTTWVSTHK